MPEDGGDKPKFLGLDEYDWQTIAVKVLTSIPWVFALIICALILTTRT